MTTLPPPVMIVDIEGSEIGVKLIAHAILAVETGCDVAYGRQIDGTHTATVVVPSIDHGRLAQRLDVMCDSLNGGQARIVDWHADHGF